MWDSKAKRGVTIIGSSIAALLWVPDKKGLISLPEIDLGGSRNTQRDDSIELLPSFAPLGLARQRGIPFWFNFSKSLLEGVIIDWTCPFQSILISQFLSVNYSFSLSQVFLSVICWLSFVSISLSAIIYSRPSWLRR